MGDTVSALEQLHARLAAASRWALGALSPRRSDPVLSRWLFLPEAQPASMGEPQAFIRFRLEHRQSTAS